MKTKDAVDRILAEYNLGEKWRPHFERIISEKIDGATSMDRETFEQIREYIRSLR